MDWSEVKNERPNSDIVGCMDLTMEDQRAIGGGDWWSAALVGAGIAAGVFAAPELLAGAALVAGYQLLTS